MRRFSRLLCLILSISFMLAPLSTLHAHLDSDHHQGVLHGGHVHHDLDDDRTDVVADSAIDVYFAAADRGLNVFSWTIWLPLMVAFAAIWMTLPYLTAILRPPPCAVRVPRSRTHHWQPPLRGPPAFAINVR